MYFATTGSEVIHTPFQTIVNGETIQEKRRREDREAFERFVGALASAQRIEAFQTKLTRYDEASTAALLENEEKLRVARKGLQDIRDRAYEITRDDGSVTKVYRDGEVVRDDDGAVVDAQLIKPSDIPSAFPTWTQRANAGDAVRQLEERREQILEFQDKTAKTRKRVEAGGVTEDELAELEADIEKSMPQHVRTRISTPMPDTQDEKEPTFQTDSRPTQAFSGAVAGYAPNSENPVKPRGPNVVTHAPK